MIMTLRTLFGTVASAAALVQPVLCHAISCDELRTDVEAKIRAGGVSAFSVSVLSSDSPSTGKVVGSCEHGSKKLIYSTAGAASQPRSAAAKAGKKEEVIITECKDGSEPVHGECKKQ